MTRFAIIFSVAFFLVASLATAQKTPIKKGHTLFELGMGLVPTYFGENANIKVLPLTARVNHQLSNNFSLGAFASYSSATSQPIKNGDGSIDVFDNTTYIFGTRAAINSNRAKNWNIYGGLMLGYSIPVVDVTSTPAVDNPKTGSGNDLDPKFYTEAKNKFVYSGFVGANYFLNNQVALFGEVSYGVSLVTVGATYRMF